MRADTQLPQLYAGGQGPYCGPQSIWAGAVRSKNKTQLETIRYMFLPMAVVVVH